jgi:NAD+ diphosphatase
MVLERLALSRSTLDRASQRRTDPELVAKLAAEPNTRVVPVHALQAPVVDDADGPHLLFSPPGDWPELVEAGPYFLGLDDEGRGYLALPRDEPPPLPDGARWAALRDVGALLDDTGSGVLTTAVALMAWHANHGCCARCGHATDVTQAGWIRHCPNCGREHYPRTDPAVIMAISDPDDRILLGRQAVWPEKRFSTLAGFVEPGESLEDAVRREVAEEAGVVVGEVTYLGSQPWPFPSSLMLGFRGRAVSTDITVDAVEIAQASWWSREELAADIAAGELRLPPGVSIARRLIEDWYGGPIDDRSDWG